MKWGKWWIILPLLKPFFNWQNWTICLRFRPPNLRIFFYPLENICPWFTIIKIIQNPFWLEWNHTIDISTFAKSVATRSLQTTKVALILSKKRKREILIQIFLKHCHKKCNQNYWFMAGIQRNYASFRRKISRIVVERLKLSLCDFQRIFISTSLDH